MAGVVPLVKATGPSYYQPVTHSKMGVIFSSTYVYLEYIVTYSRFLPH